MSISMFIFTLVNVWWISLFAVLPFGIKREDNPEALHDAGAPKPVSMSKKMLITTVVAIIITYGIHQLLLWAPIDIRNG